MNQNDELHIVQSEVKLMIHQEKREAHIKVKTLVDQDSF